GLVVLPSTRPLLVTYCGSPRAGPGMKLPYGSAATIGTFVTSLSTSSSPSMVLASFLTSDQRGMPGSWSGAAPTGFVPSNRLPVETGLPAELCTYSRRNTWCDGCEVYVWLWSTQGESVLVASWMSSALSSFVVAGSSPRMPSGPGWF